MAIPKASVPEPHPSQEVTPELTPIQKAVQKTEKFLDSLMQEGFVLEPQIVLDGTRVAVAQLNVREATAAEYTAAKTK